MFNVANVCNLIIYRRLFLAWDAFQLFMKFRMGSALGTNTHGSDVSRMVTWFNEVGLAHLVEDVKYWDGDYSADLMWMCYTIKSQVIFLNERDKELKLMRETFASGGSFRTHICDNVVYLVYNGMPSGRGDTASSNTEGNECQRDYDWMVIWEQAQMEHMATLEKKREHVHSTSVGDDGDSSVSNEAVTFYNSINIAKVRKHFGIHVTPPGKEEGEELPYVHLLDADYLKCRYRPDDNYRHVWHMMMDKNVIQELTNWVTIHGDPYQLFYSNMEDAQRFAFSHGREYFDEFTTTVEKVLKRENGIPLSLTYEELEQEFYADHGKRPGF
jgi:hypothetical protein